MQQRRLRLGDILDDYCPRERRITNHAVVAMIDDQVKQTRCTTCDADHEYKQARVPAPRRKKETLLDPAGIEPAVDETPLMDDAPMDAAAAQPAEVQATDEAPMQAEATSEEIETGEGEAREDDGPVHRRLIRATLPRPEGQGPDRKEPDFTIRHGGRGRDFDSNRAGGGGGQRHGRGRRAMRGGQDQQGGPSRFGGQRHNGPQGQRQNSNRPAPSGGGQRGGSRPQGQRGPGRKRGR
jgi:hypothetical protein